MVRHLLAPLKKRLRSTGVYELALAARQALAAQRARDTRVATLRPQGLPRGRVLLSYIVDGMLLPEYDPAFLKHTHYWETRQMARTWADMGFLVDVIHWSNQTFVPQQPYDVCIDVRANLERLAPLLPPSCIKIMHAETAHWLFHTSAQHQRLLALQGRRGAALLPAKTVAPNRAIDVADCATMLGNCFTQRTYAFANKPLYRVPISVPLTYAWPETKDWKACRTRFVWFGSGGLVHKGLDLVLEAFAAMPELHLTVCGPVRGEPDFVRVYERELYHSPNIETVDWVDVSKPQFTAIADRSLAVVYPSCSEGGGGAMLTCMHAGLIPLLSEETSVDIRPEYGVLLPENSIGAIQTAAQSLASRLPDELRQMAHTAWEFARANHTQKAFAAGYRAAAEKILATHRPELTAAHAEAAKDAIFTAKDAKHAKNT